MVYIPWSSVLSGQPCHSHTLTHPSLLLLLMQNMAPATCTMAYSSQTCPHSTAALCVGACCPAHQKTDWDALKQLGMSQLLTRMLTVAVFLRLTAGRRSESGFAKQCILLTILPTGDVLALRDVINYKLRHMRPAKPPFISKYCWARVHAKLSQWRRHHVTEKMTLQPNVLYYRQWHPRTTDLAETGSLFPRVVRWGKTGTTHRYYVYLWCIIPGLGA